MPERKTKTRSPEQIGPFPIFCCDRHGLRCAGDKTSYRVTGLVAHSGVLRGEPVMRQSDDFMYREQVAPFSVLNRT